MPAGALPPPAQQFDQAPAALAGLTLPTEADWTYALHQSNAWFGEAVANAGDVNGDGFDDVLVGASRYDGVYADEGRAYLFYGSAAGLSLAPDWIAEPPYHNLNGFFGWPVAGAGDINNDGYDDVLVGAYKYTDPAANAGAAFVWFGSVGGPAETGTPGNADWSVIAAETNVNFAISVSPAGDVNGDGLADILIGARYFSNPEVSEGCAFVYLGTVGGPEATASWQGESNQAGAYYGRYVSAAGDVNGDNLDDVIVGAYAFDTPDSDAGMAYAYYGAQAVAGLTADNDGPTALGNDTHLVASVFAGSDVTFAWDLGDGAAGNGTELDHDYAAAGTYTATVTATNRISQAVTETIVVVQEPLSSLQVSCETPTFFGQITACSASVAGGTDVSFAWDLGDGNAAAGASISHVFPNYGPFTVMVTASNLVSSAGETTVVTIEGGLFLPALLTSD